ncbi:Down syndrome cell adhesion molecule homolog [Plutella xylostella]|uniref:Down syndrome cell adhesion molecule homolog n=1 Tax=Plutella xylostella TaxID=51655 RepID=UPI0020323E35|nr:Down syndrome cell adhesion molecule homolog [Plutella xylostella]
MAHMKRPLSSCVPGPPADIKALANSEDTVIVSWLPPTQKNGKIKHYTVYSRPQRTGAHSQQIVLHKDDSAEYWAEVRGLREHQLYDFWVTAATASGEGDMSAVVARKPNARAPAKITSFGRRTLAAAGAPVRLRCGAAGAPPPVRSWGRRRPAPPLLADPRFVVEGVDLVILKLDRSLSDNYSCVVRNSWGEERAWWEVVALLRPGPVRARVAPAAATRLLVEWEAPYDGGAAILGYTVQYLREGHSHWSAAAAAGDARTLTLQRLACGARYRLRVRANNAVGNGELGEELVANTKGGPSKAAPEKDLISTNNTCVRLNLLTWESNGCPVSSFQVSLREFEDSAWRSLTVPALTQPVTVCDLAPGTWFHLKVVATSTAGTTVGAYYFATLTDAGERIPAPAVFPPAEGGVGGAPLLGAAAALAALAALLLLAAVAWRRSNTTKCFRKGYQQGEISEEEDKSIEKRDNHRNCQQVYTSSPIKHPASKKDQQEMYEISPYATFSMSGGASGEGAESGAGAGAGVAGGTLRTFAREDALLAAAPSRPSLHSHKHSSFSNADEYTLSRAMTLLVRRSESDSDSSASPPPCAECSSYRVPPGSGKGEVFRPLTDSSAESAGDARSLAARADKARRRPRRHHTPTSSRYQQRQEQERRDFTIHV